jgi:predicted nucleotidyltransferase
LLKENEKIAIRSLKEELVKRFKLVDLWLFGSKARGEDTRESDIDIMIELAETNPETESQIYDIVYDINLKNDTFISLIIFSKYEIDEGPMSESPIYKIIQKEGVLI